MCTSVRDESSAAAPQPDCSRCPTALPCSSHCDHVHFAVTCTLRPFCLAADSQSVQQHRHQLTQQISEQSQALVPGGLTRDTLCALEVSLLSLGELQTSSPKQCGPSSY